LSVVIDSYIARKGQAEQSGSGPIRELVHLFFWVAGDLWSSLRKATSLCHCNAHDGPYSFLWSREMMNILKQKQHDFHLAQGNQSDDDSEDDTEQPMSVSRRPSSNKKVRNSNRNGESRGSLAGMQSATKMKDLLKSIIIRKKRNKKPTKLMVGVKELQAMLDISTNDAENLWQRCERWNFETFHYKDLKDINVDGAVASPNIQKRRKASLKSMGSFTKANNTSNKGSPIGYASPKSFFTSGNIFETDEEAVAHNRYQKQLRAKYASESYADNEKMLEAKYAQRNTSNRKNDKTRASEATSSSSAVPEGIEMSTLPSVSFIV